MTDVKNVLRDVLHEVGQEQGASGASLLDGVRVRETRIRRRRRAATVVGSAAAAVMVVGGTFLFFPRPVSVVGPAAGPASTTQATPSVTAEVPTTAPMAAAGTVVSDFERGTQGWTGMNVSGVPRVVDDWAAAGTRSLKADLVLGGPEYSLARIGDTDLSAARSLSATVRIAPSGEKGRGVLATMYVKTGDDWTWSEGATVEMTTTGSAITVDLTTVADLAAVREIGVHILAPDNSDGPSAIYVDDVRTD